MRKERSKVNQKAAPRDIQSIKKFLMSFGQRRRRLNNRTRGTLAHVILEMRLWSVARLSNHRPSFLLWFFERRLVLFFLEETGPFTVAMVLKAPRSFLGARRLAFLGMLRFRLFRARRAWGGASASARAQARSAMS